MAGKSISFRRLTSLFIAVLLLVAPLYPAAMGLPRTRVIVQAASLDAAVAAVQEGGGVVEAEIPIINAVVARVSDPSVQQLMASPGVIRVTADRSVQTAGKPKDKDDAAINVEIAKAIGVQAVWDSGNLGEGITVAVLDTGIDTRFPELRSGPRNNGNRYVAYYDALSDTLYQRTRLARAPGDPSGHGTHIAGIIANNHFERKDGEYRGVAPEAGLVAVRVLNEQGAGTYADVLKGINWIVQNKDVYNIRVLNISMYAVPVAPYWADPYNLAVMAAWQAGIVVVASAGNTGPAPMSIGVPGNTPYIITVGAFTDHRTPHDLGDDYIPEFSAAGPTLDAFVKPDVVAPAAHVVSLMQPNSYLPRLYPDRRVGGRYFEMSGTSMSTAVVSGIAALVLEENPDLTPDEVKFRLTQTARPQLSEETGAAAYSIWQQGAGRVWAEDAVLGDITGAANAGMDLAADLNGQMHYQGWTVYDGESGQFAILGGGFDGFIEDYTTWSGSFSSWADGYEAWAGGPTNWANSFHSWADSFHSWADGNDTWTDSFHSWADSFHSWADSFHSWADVCVAEPTETAPWVDSFSSWADSFGSWADSFHSWADAVVWTDSFHSWADSFHSWADSFHSWADNAEGCEAWLSSFDSWTGGFTGWVDGNATAADALATWTGAYGSWSGGYLTWTDSFHSWADSFHSWADGYAYWIDVCGIDADSFGSWADSFGSWADSFGSWADSFGSWADSFSSWADYVVWVDSFGSWADSFGSWADSFSSWADGYEDPTRPVICSSWADSFGSWADSFGSWADSFGSWADVNPNFAGAFEEWDGGYTAWMGGHETWTGSFGSWADNVGDPAWADAYCSLSNVATPLSAVGINLWIDPE